MHSDATSHLVSCDPIVHRGRFRAYEEEEDAAVESMQVGACLIASQNTRSL